MGEGAGGGGQKAVTPHLNPPPQGGRRILILVLFQERRIVEDGETGRAEDFRYFPFGQKLLSRTHTK